MIESVQELPITLRTRSANCCNGWLQHQEGSPLYQILEGGYYEVIFNTNASSATAGVIALGLYQDGILVPGTTVASTLAAAGDIENLKFTKVVRVCCRANATLTVASVPSVPNFTNLTGPGIDTQIPIIANANFIIKKVA